MTKHITFLRRKALGAGSLRGLYSLMNNFNGNTTSISVRDSAGSNMSIIRNDFLPDTSSQDTSETLLVRWGCTTPTGTPLDRQVNPSSAITFTSNKRLSRMEMQRQWPGIVPPTFDSVERLSGLHVPHVVRPEKHAQGRNLFVVNNLPELLEVLRKPCMAGGWYASKLIDKVAEYRVYVVQGRVAVLSQKIPYDTSQVAWNTHVGSEFVNVRWGDWPMQVIDVALKAFQVTGLDFSGIDVMVDGEGKAYVLEANSAPSLPLKTDGTPTYRHKCMAKCFQHIAENGKEHFESVTQLNGWRDAVHPAVL